MSEQQARPERRWFRVLVSLALLLSGCATERSEMSGERDLVAADIQGLLASDEVRMLNLLRKRLSELPLSETARTSLAEPLKPKEDLLPISTFFEIHLSANRASRETAADDMESVQRQIETRTTFKDPFESLEDATHVYQIGSCAPTVFERIATWDKQQEHVIFTNEAGEIVGWIPPRDDK